MRIDADAQTTIESKNHTEPKESAQVNKGFVLAVILMESGNEY